MTIARVRCGFGVAGLLALVLATAAPAVAQSERSPTGSTGIGPEYQADAPRTAQLWKEGDPGEPLHLRGRVISTSGEPLAGAEVQLWQADGGGSYHADRYRTRLVADDRGEFGVLTALPGSRFGARHIHVVVTHAGYRSLTTRVLFEGDPNLRSADADLAIPLDEVHTRDRTIKVGDVELVLAPE